MPEALTIIAVTIAAFIGTNLDNLVLLVAFHNRYENHTGMVTGGYITGMILIGAFCLLIGEVGEVIPTNYLGLLGVIPMAIGCKALVRLWRQREHVASKGVTLDNGFHGIFLTVLMTQLSNGADSIITFSVLMAESSDAADYLIMPVFLGMVFIFGWLAYYAINHRNISDFVSRYGDFITPFILILVGAYILANTATDLMPG
jgi:cadmium resistance protein CadD (predicted permease)